MVDVEEVETDERDFEELLNDSFGDVNICGMNYPAGTALKKVDPIAFRVANADEPIRFKCGECDEIHEEDEDAQECCKEEED